jgi:acetylornithine deacetylase/succinyl-diaminopimelate desuccinylase-like protein|tara:strand:- start:2791 stop:4467 length:1677 start_codon:yes stop_codon:yes gene_type:complete
VKLALNNTNSLVKLFFAIGSITLLVSCSEEAAVSSVPVSAAPMAVAAAEIPESELGIRSVGDEAVEIDMSQIHSQELKDIYAYIDENIDDHVLNLQNWIQQPSISNTGEGIQESAYMVKGFFDQLGCQETQVYDVGITEWGQQGNPVVYANCDEGAEKTLAVYWMYDTMPVTQPDLWKAPPFEGRIVEQAPYAKVMIGRGATNSKGPQMTQLNALMSIKAVTGKLPVNLIFIAEGDEERMSIGYRKFVRDHPELVADADAMYRFGRQGGISGGSEGSIFIELITSGAAWGRGPNYSNIHGGNKRSVDAPAWRHIKMLSTLIDDTGNQVMFDGFYDNIEPLKEEELVKLRNTAANIDMEVAARNLGVERFITDDPLEYITMARYGSSMNLDGIWGGNMFEGGSGAILPNRIVSKHNFRYVPFQDGQDIVDKLRIHLDKFGYEDVEINIVGDVPWAKMTYDNDISRAVMKTFDTFDISYVDPVEGTTSMLGGYWPAYLFAGDVMDIPIVSGQAGSGGNAHAANEYFVIEGANKMYGMAGGEKSVATVLYNYAGLNEPKSP